MKKTRFYLISKRVRLLLLVSVLGVLFTSCKKSEKAPEKQASGISWYEEGIVSALEKSKKENRPLFVYWGAQWCPPCNIVKATVFKDSDFISATKKFIAVYLDGDTESAQEWGEKLNASGYPTLMVLNPKGKEVVRFSTSMSPKEFAESLHSVYDNLNPIDELIADILQTPASLIDPKSWQIVAGYSWAQAKKYKGKIDWVDSFEKLEQKAPAKMRLEKERLFLNSVVARLSKLKKDEGLEERLVKTYRPRIKALIQTPETFQEHYKLLTYYAADITQRLYPQKSEERDEFISTLKSSLKIARSQHPVGSHRHLIGFYPLVELAELEGESLPLAEKDLIKKEMLAAVDGIDSSYEQVFVTNTTSYILRKAGLSDLARKILLEDIKKSKTPFYAMASLASMEKKLDNKGEALKWIERAYNTSKGNATRLQWGSNYLIYMMELSPEKKDKILRELQKFYRVHLKMPDAFMGRNKKRLARISKRMKKWGEDKSVRASLKELRQKWLDSCDKKSAVKTDYYRQGCRDYFSELI